MIRASQILFWFGLSIAASLALYHTSDRTHALEMQLRHINASIESEEQGIHVLKAEWVYLANPARVESTAKKHLALRVTAPAQVIALDDLDDTLPTREQAMASVDVSSTPIANVKTSLTMPASTPRVSTRKIAVVAANSGHINDRIVIQHSAQTASVPADAIGALIDELGSRP